MNMSSCLLVTWPLATAYNESGLICLSSDVGCSCWCGVTAASGSYLTISRHQHFVFSKIPKIIDPMKSIQSQFHNLTISQSHNHTSVLQSHNLTISQSNTLTLLHSHLTKWLYISSLTTYLLTK